MTGWERWSFDMQKIVYAQPRVYPGEWDAQTPLGFWDTNGSLNLGQMTKFSNNHQEKIELAELWTLQSWLIIEWNHKKTRRRIRALTLLGTWKWQLYQL